MITLTPTVPAMIQFCKEYPTRDDEIEWTCPNCKAKNYGAYYSHVSKCVNCSFELPALRIKCLDSQRRKEIILQIRNLQDENEDLESELYQNKTEIDELRDELRELRT